ncbi:MAG: 30S ribosomal protein S4 [bacterium]|nr:30S ribosomal protein S4 [bacterium]
MKRYSHKMCRRYGVKLCQSEKCPVSRRNYPPGIHGPKGRPRLTEYGIQLAEKQKAKIIYNVSEKQFRLTFESASRVQGDAGQNFISLLEMRLDNTIYRLGLASTRAQARQLVNHGHFLVNDKKINIPSFKVSSGDVISLHQSSFNSNFFKEALPKVKIEKIPGWLNFDQKNNTAKILHAPKKGDLELGIDTQAIVEFYSRQ